MNKFTRVLESTEFKSTISDILLDYEERYNLKHYLSFDFYIDINGSQLGEPYSFGQKTQNKEEGFLPCFILDISSKLDKVNNISEFLKITGDVVSKLENQDFLIHDFSCDTKKKFSEYILDSNIWIIDKNNKVRYTFLNNILTQIKNILNKHSFKIEGESISNDVLNILIPKRNILTKDNDDAIKDIFRILKIGIQHKVTTTKYINDEVCINIQDSSGVKTFIQIEDIRKNKEENYKKGFHINR
jgi:hypothetical protein